MLCLTLTCSIFYSHILVLLWWSDQLVYAHRWEKSGNEELAIALNEWLLKERGVLRVGRVAHHKFDPKLPPGLNDSRPMPQHYTILEEVVCVFLCGLSLNAHYEYSNFKSTVQYFVQCKEIFICVSISRQ